MDSHGSPTLTMNLLGELLHRLINFTLKDIQTKQVFFGFFDVIDNPQIAQQLLKTAEQWLMKQGMRTCKRTLSVFQLTMTVAYAS